MDTRFLVRGSTREANRFAGTGIPMEDVAAGGRGAVLQLRRSRFYDGFGVIRDIGSRMQQGCGFADCSSLNSSAGDAVSISIMTEPPQVKGIQQRRSVEQPNIPSGVMQAVLMHALQLRPSCREVFLLCDIQRHSVSEAAVILGISRTIAKRRLLLARRRMDEVIERLLEAKPKAEIQVSDGWAGLFNRSKSGAEGGI